MTALVLDSQAFSVLARGQSAEKSVVRAALRAALETEARVVVPAAVLAELYRGGTHDQIVDSCLGRNTIGVVDTTKQLARQVGNLLARAGRGSRDHVDATVVAAAVSHGGGVILTSDVGDISALADGLIGITVESIR